MRKPTFYIMAVVFLLIIGLLIAPLQPIAARTDKIITSQETSERNKDQESEVDIVRGLAVKNHVEKMKLKNKGLARALKDMERIGKVPNWEASGHIVEKRKRSAQLQNSDQFKPVSFLSSDEIGDGNGNSMTIITYNGDDRYWEGTVSTYNASTDITDVYNGVIEDLVSGDVDSSEVVDEYFYPDTGDAPSQETPCEGRFCLPQPDMGSIHIDSNQKQVSKASYHYGINIARPGFLGWFKRFFKCVKRCNRISNACKILPTRYRTTCRIVSVVSSSVVCAFNTNSCQ